MSRNVKDDKLVCMVCESICTYVSLVGLLYRRCKLDVDLPQVDLMNFRVELGREAAVVWVVLNKQDEGLFRKSTHDVANLKK